MFGIDDAVLAAGVSALGSAAVGAMSNSGQHSANRANRRLAREQMDFQERMSSTAYQRAMQDMENAGLNPILAYSQGGASSPIGASAQMQSDMSGAVSSALDAKRAFAEVDNLREQNKKIQADTDLAKAQTLAAINQSDVNFNSAEALRLDNQVRAINTKIEESPAGLWLNFLRRLNPVSSAFQSVKTPNVYNFNR